MPGVGLQLAFHAGNQITLPDVGEVVAVKRFERLRGSGKVAKSAPAAPFQLHFINVIINLDLQDF